MIIGFDDCSADRFKGPDGLYNQAEQNLPGPGAYEQKVIDAYSLGHPARLGGCGGWGRRVTGPKLLVDPTCRTEAEGLH